MLTIGQRKRKNNITSLLEDFFIVMYLILKLLVVHQRHLYLDLSEKNLQ